MHSPERELLWLRRVRDLSHLLASETDLEPLLPRILDAGLELTGAERGMLVLVRERRADGSLARIRVEAARGFDKASLHDPENAFSRTVVKRVLDRGDRGLVTSSAEDRDVLAVTSVQERAFASILCVPLRLRGEVHGVLYLDHRQRDHFSEADLPILQSFAAQAALALETAGRTAPEPVAPTHEALVGTSEAMRALQRQLDACARTWAPVLVFGESGSGKELVAREVHGRSERADEPFLTVATAGESASSLAHALFGVVPSAFGAGGEPRPGALEQAGRGAVYLDDVAELDSRTQALLLRALQEERVRPMGGGEGVPLRCRIYAATGQDLRAQVAAGAFREDLYYLLDVMHLRLPPLRSRPEDLPLLIERFGQRAGAPLGLSPRALELLQGYSWPGNVRELTNELQRLAALDLRRLSSQHLSEPIREGRGVPRAAGEGFSGKTLGEVERAMVAAAMRESKGNKAQAARQLGIPRSTLYHLLERYELT